MITINLIKKDRLPPLWLDILFSLFLGTISIRKAGRALNFLRGWAVAMQTLTVLILLYGLWQYVDERIHIVSELQASIREVDSDRPIVEQLMRDASRTDQRLTQLEKELDDIKDDKLDARLKLVETDARYFRYIAGTVVTCFIGQLILFFFWYVIGKEFQRRLSPPGS